MALERKSDSFMVVLFDNSIATNEKIVQKITQGLGLCNSGVQFLPDVNEALGLNHKNKQKMQKYLIMI